MGRSRVTIASYLHFMRARVIWRSQPWRRLSRPTKSRKLSRPTSPSAEWSTKNAARRCGRCLTKIIYRAKSSRSETHSNAQDFGCGELRFYWLANTASKFVKPLISMGLPDGSRKNMVHCSPGSPSKRTEGGRINATCAAESRAAKACQSGRARTMPKCGIGTK